MSLVRSCGAPWAAGRAGRGGRVEKVVVGALLCVSCGRGGGAGAVQPGTPAGAQVGPDTSGARTPGGPEQCFNARDDDGNGLIDEGCGLRTGPVQFVIAWDAPAADVDLLVTDPQGELSDVGHPTSSGLVKERDCPGRHEECRGRNYENVFVEKDEARRGTYKVSIRLERLEDEDVPIRVTLGARVGPQVYSAEVDLSRVEEQAELTFEL